MPNLTPARVRPKYQLYENKICVEEDSDQCRSYFEWRIELTGLKVEKGRGDSLRSMKRRPSDRSSTEIVKSLVKGGYIPSYCTACYRLGRTGDRFMQLAKSGQIQKTYVNRMQS